MRSVISKICSSVTVVGIMGCTAFAQVNIISDEVNFRTNVTNDYLKLTNMYGVMKVYSSVPSVPNVMGSCFYVNQ